MPNSLSTASADQVSVAGGNLVLNAVRPTSAATFSSGSVSTYTKYNFASGYAEARIDLPSTPGSWPAFWGLYNGWPPEADIMEYPLTTNGGTSGYSNNQYSTNYHYTNSSGAAAAGAGVVTTNQNLSTTGYHVFAMDWVANTSVKFFLDGTQVSSYTGSAVSQMVNMYMILDYAVGGWPGTPSVTQWPVGFSDQTKVDYVHVWQKNAGLDAPSNWNVNGGGAFSTAGNWSAGSPKYGNQTAVFGRVGTASSAAISMANWHVFGGITFDGNATGTTAYTLGTASTQIQLASTAGPLVQATANSTVNQNINARIELWNNTTAKNDMTGGQTLNFNSEVSGSGTLNVSGVGTTNLNAANTFTGGTVVGTNQEAAVLRVNADNALGTGGVVIGTAGNLTTARLEIAGGRTVNNAIDFRGRNNNSVGIQSVGGNNTLAGTITANSGGSVYQIQSDGGSLALTGAAGGGVALQAGSGTRAFVLQGAGDGVVSGKVQNGAGTVSVVKAGTGTWSISGANTYSGVTMIADGTLLATPAAYGNLLNNAGGVDLTGPGARLTLDYVGDVSPVAQVTTILNNAYASKFASGQIRSSTAAGSRVLGYGDNGSAVTVRSTLGGDANLDGVVNFSDFLILQGYFLQPDTRFDQGNFNYDGVTNFSDFLILQGNFLQSVNPTVTVSVTPAELRVMQQFMASGGSVPEPAMLSLIGIGAAGLMRRKRHVSN